MGLRTVAIGQSEAVTSQPFRNFMKAMNQLRCKCDYVAARRTRSGVDVSNVLCGMAR